MRKYIVAAMFGLFLGSVAGVAGAQDERKLTNCVIVKTIETDSKGRTIIIVSKSCEVKK